MYQIIISEWGLSLGEKETINNLFSNYQVIDNPIDNILDYSTILEVEFIKNTQINFFEDIPIEKWTYFIEIIKNIKKRRGNKGLKFKLMITDYNEVDNDITSSNDRSYNTTNNNTRQDNHEQGNKGIEDPERESDQVIEILLQFYKKTIFLLGHLDNTHFSKGLERIEITIENLDNLHNKIINQQKNAQDLALYQKENLCATNKGEIFHNYINTKNNEVADLYIFIFDGKKRIWHSI